MQADVARHAAEVPGVNDLVAHPPNHLLRCADGSARSFSKGCRRLQVLLGANVHASGSVLHLRCKQDFGVLLRRPNFCTWKNARICRKHHVTAVLFDIGRLWVCLRLPFNDCLLVAAHPRLLQSTISMTLVPRSPPIGSRSIRQARHLRSRGWRKVPDTYA